MKNASRRQAGFSLIELVVVLAILGVASTYWIRSQGLKYDADRVANSQDNMRIALEAGMNYYAQNTAWPANIAALQTANDLPSTTLLTGWGQTISAAPAGGGSLFTVSATFPTNQFACEVAGALPAATCVGTTTTASVVIPGAEASLAGYLPLDTHVALTGADPLNMSSKDITNAGNVTMTGTLTDTGSATVTGTVTGETAMQTPNINGVVASSTTLTGYNLSLTSTGTSYVHQLHLDTLDLSTGAETVTQITGVGVTTDNNMSTHNCNGLVSATACGLADALFYANAAAITTGTGITKFANPCSTTATTHVFPIPLAIQANSVSDVIGGFTVNPGVVGVGTNGISITTSVSDNGVAVDTNVKGYLGIMIQCY